MSLWSDILTSPAPPEGRPFQKWAEYMPAYEKHFNRFVNRPVTIFEIGVAEGGSLQMWKRYFGPYATVVGLDIVDYRQFAEEQVYIRVGSQDDEVVLQSMVDQFGPPDIVLDDGSHTMEHIHATFDYLYPRMSTNGVYAVEDLHTAYWPEYGGGLQRPGSFIETAKVHVDMLNADHSRGALAPNGFTRTTLSMHFYDSMVVYERGVRRPNRSILRFY